MIDNTITLPVDTENTGSTTDYDYTRFDELLNRSLYTGEDHSYALRDTLGLYRTLPKRAGNLLGVRKSAAKFTKDFQIPGYDAETTIVQPAILEISSSLPVGVSAADALELRQRAIALLDSELFIRVMENCEY